MPDPVGNTVDFSHLARTKSSLHEEGERERGGRRWTEERKTRGSRTTCPLLLRLFAPLIAILFLLEVAPRPRRRGNRVTFLPRPLRSGTFASPLFRAWQPEIRCYKILSFPELSYTSLFLNINETVSPVLLFRQVTLISFTETVLHLFASPLV